MGGSVLARERDATGADFRRARELLVPTVEAVMDWESWDLLRVAGLSVRGPRAEKKLGLRPGLEEEEEEAPP